MADFVLDRNFSKYHDPTKAPFDLKSATAWPNAPADAALGTMATAIISTDAPAPTERVHRMYHFSADISIKTKKLLALGCPMLGLPYLNEVEAIHYLYDIGASLNCDPEIMVFPMFGTLDRGDYNRTTPTFSGEDSAAASGTQKIQSSRWQTIIGGDRIVSGGTRQINAQGKIAYGYDFNGGLPNLNTCFFGIGFYNTHAQAKKLYNGRLHISAYRNYRAGIPGVYDSQL